MLEHINWNGRTALNVKFNQENGLCWEAYPREIPPLSPDALEWYKQKENKFSHQNRKTEIKVGSRIAGDLNAKITAYIINIRIYALKRTEI